MELKPESTERCVAFVVARLSSSRLEAKHFQLIGDQPLLGWTISGLKKCQEFDEIVITTVEEPENVPLRDYAEQTGVACFWYQGHVDHVTTRLRKAAEEYSADICLLISGDCPLMEPSAIDSLVRQFRQQPQTDCLQVKTGKEGLGTAQEGVGIFRLRAWQRADDLSDRPELKEHQFPLIWQNQELFPVALAELPDSLLFQQHRFSVDTQADLDFMRTLHTKLVNRGESFALPQVLSLLRKCPELLEINRHVHQRRLIEEVKKVLYVIDAGEGFGYGHLMRSLELANQLTERLSWPVTFLTDDKRAAELLTSSGIRVLHGALGREAKEHDSVLISTDFDLCLLDLAARPLSADWREQLPTEARLVAIDSLAKWSTQTDLIVVPGVTGPKGGEQDNLRQGLERVILRRAIRQQVTMKEDKNLDLLCYAHSDKRERLIQKICLQNNWSYEIVRGQRDDFPQLLTRSRVFLGNFGYSFYEALALGCQLIAWPLTEQHARDAELFFQRLGLPSRLAGPECDLQTLLENTLSDDSPPVEIIDGTPLIINDIAELFQQEPQTGQTHGGAITDMCRRSIE